MKCINFSDPSWIKLDKLKKDPLPTIFTLSVDQDRPGDMPKLKFNSNPDFVDHHCTCEKALRRFDPNTTVVSDGIFVLSIMCLNQKTYEDRQRILKGLIHEFAQFCEHERIMKKLKRFIEPKHEFVPYQIIPNRRMDRNGILIAEPDSDLDSDVESEDQVDEPVPESSALFHFNTVINNALIRSLMQPLPRVLETSQMTGYIYILKTPRIPGMLKIGMTTKDPAVRQSQWDRCYPTIQLHANTSEVPYARVVEELIHTELLAHRFLETCPRCKAGKNSKRKERSHTEWFRVTEQLAEQVVLRWAKWMGSGPYHKDTRTLSLTWADRLNHARERAYRPGVDYILSVGAETWQNFTDMRRPKGAEDDSGEVQLVLRDKKVSRFLERPQERRLRPPRKRRSVHVRI